MIDPRRATHPRRRCPVEITDDVHALSATGGGTACCLVSRDQADDIRDGLRLLGLPDGWLPSLPGMVHPEVRVSGESVLVVMFGTNPDLDLVPWAFAAGRGGVLVVGDPEAPLVRSAIEACEQDEPLTVLAAAVLGLARSIPGVVSELSEKGIASSGQSMSRAVQRSLLRDQRARLFVLQTMFAAQKEIVGHGEELSELSGEQGTRFLRRARAVFGFGSGSCARLYAQAGDLLTEETSLVNERLTLVATLFLPLSAATGFFGMNFSWLTDRIGGLPAFLVLGVLVPVVTTALTVFVIRRLGANGS